MKANLNKCHLLLSTTDAFNFEISPPPPHPPPPHPSKLSPKKPTLTRVKSLQLFECSDFAFGNMILRNLF